MKAPLFMTISVSTIKRALQAMGIWILFIFAWFVASGLPGFYDPYKLDGKGINPNLYLCDGFRRDQYNVRQENIGIEFSLLQE